ncbi:potassium channel family protein [Parvularcula lutaonensis]|uniref:Potassium channel family protein n=1 Tax=Parvularcula lutaonensis TaxID=491923 RepID=A0ABV7MF11_9PROT|nr:potassium channel family protein [Parvularcula lutaonensis]GGY53939.1 potassium transporter Kef [Parvularcula lutaonensis]
MGKLREAVHRQLDPEAWPGRGFSPVNWAILFAIGFLIFLSILTTEPSVMAALGPEILFVEQVILALFAIELLLRFWTIGLNPRFRGARGIFHYAIRPSTIADILVVTPLFIAVPPGWIPILRLVRVLRLLRLAAMPRVQKAFAEFGGALLAKRFEFLLTACFALALLLASSTILYLTEGDVQPEAFGSIPRAIWWSVVTFTTVGYGDAVPVTWVGRFFAGTFAVLGIGLVAMLTGIVASALTEASERHNSDDS